MVREPSPTEHIVTQYGDLLFDLCESVLWSPSNAQIAFRTVLKKLKSSRKDNAYSLYERAWVLRVACDELRSLSNKHGRKLSSFDQIRMDSSSNFSARMKDFEFYFHRLEIEDQLVLLLKDKYGLPFDETAAALGVPEGTLKVKRQQALRTLEEWLWDLK